MAASGGSWSTTSPAAKDCKGRPGLDCIHPSGGTVFVAAEAMQAGRQPALSVGRLSPSPVWQTRPCPCRRQHPGATPHLDHWSAAGWLALEKQWEFQDGDSGGSRDCASGGWHVDGAAKRSGSSTHRTSSGILARMPAPPLLPVLSAPLLNAVPAAQGAAAPAAPESELRSPWLKDSKCHACGAASYLPRRSRSGRCQSAAAHPE